MGCHVRRWTTTLALTVLLAGCGGQSAPSAAPTAARPTESTAATTTPATLSLADAKARYLEIVAPYNEALEALETAANGGKSWTAVRTLAGKVAQTNAAHAEALRAIAWPEPVREPMAALLAEADAAQRHWERAASAKGAEELAGAIRDAARRSGAKQAGKVREALGLPPYRES